MQSQTYFDLDFDILGTSDLTSLALIIEAYRDHCPRETVAEVGFNTSSGNVYIALENRITIFSAFGTTVQYSVYDYQTETETELNSFEEAEEFLNNLSE